MYVSLMALLAQCTRMWLFYLKCFRGESGRLSLNTTREVCAYISDLLLANVSNLFLRFFNCCTSTWGPRVRLHNLIQADAYSVWMLLEDGRLFCSGGEC